MFAFDSWQSLANHWPDQAKRKRPTHILKPGAGTAAAMVKIIKRQSNWEALPSA
jgi:hypothetical protein